MNEWNQQKRELLDAANWRCELCGGKGEQVDHAIYSKARHRQGSVDVLDEKYNLIVTCQRCNQKKPQRFYPDYPTYGAWALDVNIAKYGADRMNEWMDRVEETLQITTY